MSRHCVRAMGVCQALMSDANQATGEGKSGPVKTGLTGLVATVMSSDIVYHDKMKIVTAKVRWYYREGMCACFQEKYCRVYVSLELL